MTKLEAINKILTEKLAGTKPGKTLLEALNYVNQTYGGQGNSDTMADALEQLYEVFSKGSEGDVHFTWVDNYTGYAESAMDLIESMDFSDIDFSNATVTSRVFCFPTTPGYTNFRSLRNIVMHNKTTKHLTSSSGFFWGMPTVETIDIGGSDFSSFTSLSSMFRCLSSLKHVFFNGVTFGAVTSLSSMFSECSALEEIDLSMLDISKVTSIDFFAFSCKALKHNIGDSRIRFKNFTSAITSMRGAFSGSGIIEIPQLCKPFNPSPVKDMSGAFENCKSLSPTTFGAQMEQFITSALTNISDCFAGCTSLTYATFDTLDMSGITGSTSNASSGTASMFEGCTNLKTVSFKNVNMKNVGYVSAMFRYCTALESVDMSGIDATNIQCYDYWFGRRGYDSSFTKLTTVVWPTNLGLHSKITEIDLGYLSALNHDSVLDLYNKLANKKDTATTSGTLRLPSAVQALMTEEEIRIATDKGWTIAP